MTSKMAPQPHFTFNGRLMGINVENTWVFHRPQWSQTMVPSLWSFRWMVCMFVFSQLTWHRVMGKAHLVPRRSKDCANWETQGRQGEIVSCTARKGLSFESGFSRLRPVPP
jgi:hypothetical protein